MAEKPAKKKPGRPKKLPGDKRVIVKVSFAARYEETLKEMAEKSGFEGSITAWLSWTALQQAVKWQEDRPK